MSSTSPAPRRGEPIARSVRPLPDSPSLEHERKDAKALLRRLRAGDADSLHRVQSIHAVALRDRRPDELKLADAQHVIAREYGFASWPRLVEYFEDLERHRHSARHNSPDDGAERFQELARSIVRRHQRGDPLVARELAHFVPRFYARPIAEILATPITDDEAQLVVARERRRVSWKELIERAGASRARRDRNTWEGENVPFARARNAIRAHDVAAVAAILDAHPELLTPSVIEREWRQTLARMALDFERDAKTPEARRLTELLVSRGVDVQRELNERLLGWPHEASRPEAVRWYLDRGANPSWMPSNGIPVLEHAIGRYRNGACVDLIAERVTPRRALWIAAGLGDVSGVKSFVKGKGTLTPDARLNRPDPIAMNWWPAFPTQRDADDLEIMWEAFEIAGWNDRWDAMDALLAAGLPVDHAPMGVSLLMEAVGNRLVPLAEYLVSRGADLDREWLSYGSARALARSHVANDPKSDDARRLIAICDAGTPADILAELDAQRQTPAQPEERMVRAMQLAADDAARQGQSAVTTENMLIGLLRVGDGILAEFLMDCGTNMPRLRAMIGARLLPDRDPLIGQDLPPDAVAEAAVRTAAAEATSRRREHVSPIQLLDCILSQEGGAGARLLREVGSKQAGLGERLRTLL